MAIYNYNELKEIAKKVRAEFANIIEKTVRRKPRDREKREILFTMAINRLKRYPPRKTDKGIILPYFNS